jgi:hypothetical protein
MGKKDAKTLILPENSACRGKDFPFAFAVFIVRHIISTLHFNSLSSKKHSKKPASVQSLYLARLSDHLRRPIHHLRASPNSDSKNVCFWADSPIGPSFTTTTNHQNTGDVVVRKASEKEFSLPDPARYWRQARIIASRYDSRRCRFEKFPVDPKKAPLGMPRTSCSLPRRLQGIILHAAFSVIFGVILHARYATVVLIMNR